MSPPAPDEELSDPGPMTRERWASEALKALGAGGLSAVSVERLARRLGVTKGSFYWHFKNRDALLSAALERLEANNAAAIADFEQRYPDPRVRLRALFVAAFEPSALGALLLNLASHRAHPVIGPVLDRVTAARLDDLARMFREIGLDERRAHNQALLSYSAYVGLYQLSSTAPDRVPEGPQLASYVSYLVDALVP